MGKVVEPTLINVSVQTMEESAVVVSANQYSIVRKTVQVKARKEGKAEQK